MIEHDERPRDDRRRDRRDHLRRAVGRAHARLDARRDARRRARRTSCTPTTCRTSCDDFGVDRRAPGRAVQRRPSASATATAAGACSRTSGRTIVADSARGRRSWRRARRHRAARGRGGAAAQRGALPRARRERARHRHHPRRRRAPGLPEPRGHARRSATPPEEMRGARSRSRSCTPTTCRAWPRSSGACSRAGHGRARRVPLPAQGRLVAPPRGVRPHALARRPPTQGLVANVPRRHRAREAERALRAARRAVPPPHREHERLLMMCDAGVRAHLREPVGRPRCSATRRRRCWATRRRTLMHPDDLRGRRARPAARRRAPGAVACAPSTASGTGTARWRVLRGARAHDRRRTRPTTASSPTRATSPTAARREEALQRSEEHFRALIENGSDLILDHRRPTGASRT